ncbi:hypothetical protein ACFLY2_02275 [Patescibacteria group bacterium]
MTASEEDMSKRVSFINKCAYFLIVIAALIAIFGRNIPAIVSIVSIIILKEVIIGSIEDEYRSD